MVLDQSRLEFRGRAEPKEPQAGDVATEELPAADDPLTSIRLHRAG
jgi:hypothetical protein